MFLALWEFIIQLGEIGLYTCSHNMKQIIILKRTSLEGYEWLQWVEKSLEIIPVAAAKSLQSCPTLCDPMDGSPPGSPIPGILQARTLEWVAISFSNAWKWKVKVKSSVVSDTSQPHGLQPTKFLRPWDFPDKNTGVGCHFLLQEIFPTKGLKPGLPHCRQTLYHLSHQGSPSSV